jgi:hypothetical protein
LRDGVGTAEQTRVCSEAGEYPLIDGQGGTGFRVSRRIRMFAGKNRILLANGSDRLDHSIWIGVELSVAETFHKRKVRKSWPF